VSVERLVSLVERATTSNRVAVSVERLVSVAVRSRAPTVAASVDAHVSVVDRA
jgi:hypothetical protein